MTIDSENLRMKVNLKKKTHHIAFAWCAVFIAFISLDTLAQTGKYELRFVQDSFDCATRKVVFSAQIRATSTSNQFILGTANVPFEFPGDSLSNPVLISRDNYSGGQYGQLSLTQQGSTLSINTLYQGNAPFADTLNVKTNWISIAHIGFDVPISAKGCYTLSWSTLFPTVDLFEVIISAGTATEISTLPGIFTSLSGCAFDAALPAATMVGDTSIFFGEQATIKVNFTGENPVTLSVDGITYSNLSTSPLLINVFPDSTTTFTVTSVSNSCGVGTISGSATVIVLKPTIKTSNLSSSQICAGSAIQVPFINTDSFGPGNVFIVQLSDPTGTNFVDIPTTGTISPLTATIPASTPAANGYRVRVVASDPVIIGDSSAVFSISGAPTATLSGVTTITQGDTATLSVSLTGKAPWSVLLTNNVTYTATSSPLLIKVTPADTTTYSLVTVSDSCQNGTALGSSTVNVLPLASPPTISTSDIQASTVCPGSTVPVSYTSTGLFQSGNVFTVQLSNVSGTNFVNIPTTGTGSPLMVTIPSSIPVGSGYRMLVVASNPATTSDPSAAFSVAGAPTAILSGDTTIVSGGTATLRVQLSGTAPWTVMLSDSRTVTSSTSPMLIQVSPTTTTSYSIASFTGACGVGTMSGTATVVSGEPPIVCKPVCVPIQYQILNRR
jgi:hypothetical protein